MERFVQAVGLTGQRAPGSKAANTASRAARESIGRIGTMLTFSGKPLGGFLAFGLKRMPNIPFVGGAVTRRTISPLPMVQPTAPGAVAGGVVGAQALGGE